MTTLSTLTERIKKAPSRAADEVEDFRANCERLFHAALQISNGGAYRGTFERFPALCEQREKVGGFKNLFKSMTRGPLWLWANAFFRWLSQLPPETQTRMLAEEIL